MFGGMYKELILTFCKLVLNLDTTSCLSVTKRYKSYAVKPEYEMTDVGERSLKKILNEIWK